MEVLQIPLLKMLISHIFGNGENLPIQYIDALF